MRRKIVQHGSSSLTISLPYKWTQKFNLKKGDEIELEELGHSIVISSNGTSNVHKATFTITDKKKFLRRYIISLYKQGYDEIEILSNDGLPFDKIKDVLNEVMGFEIMEQSAKRCLIKNVSQPMESEFDTILRRAFLVTLSMVKEAKEAIGKGEFESLKEVTAMQYTNNKLSNLCQRILNKRGYKNHIKTNYLYSIVDQIEQIADHCGDMCDYLIKNRIKIDKKIITFYDQITNLLEYTYETFYNFNQDKMIYLKRTINEKQQELLNLFGIMQGKQLIVVHYLLQILERINHLSIYIISV
jgi:phosphate uptake regulator